jgi:hypothetical protein
MKLPDGKGLQADEKKQKQTQEERNMDDDGCHLTCERDERHERKQTHVKTNVTKGYYSRSRHEYGDPDKARGLRRKADRHSHHRRRNTVRSQLAHGVVHGVESLPGPSSGKLSHHKSHARLD